MIFNARFPVFLREVRPHGFRNRVPAVLFLDTSVDILEVSSSDAPIVLHATSEHFAGGKAAEFEFRILERRFYRRVNLRAVDFEAGVLRTPWVRPEGLRKLIDQIYLEVLPHQKKAYPVAIADIFRGDARPWVNQMNFITRSARAEIDEGHQARVDDARIRFEDACTSYIVIDGNIWQECREPLLAVEMEPQSRERGKISIFSGELPSYAPLLAPDYPASSVQLFPFNEIETARSVARQAAKPERSGAGDGFSVEFQDGIHFSNDFPYIEDAVRILFELQTDNDVPRELIVRVAEFLADDTQWTYDMAEELLQGCVAASRSMSDAWLVVPSLLERLRNRPISLGMDDLQPSFGLR
ncbi:hypothetical protein HFN89_05875 [Rhizobium laguerreae]|nr:hypothetical protein [Rhizobium laguerreae]